MTWSAAQYSKFEDERNRPIHDLLARLPAAEVRRAIDLGCGPGNSTDFLRQRFPDAVVGGLDSSADMLTAARKRLPGVTFELGDIATWRAAAPVDVIFANAALQWVPDHEGLLPNLLSSLAPGGSLAVQVPDNLDEPAHRLMREVAVAGPWAEALKNAAKARSSRHTPDWYYRVLRAQGTVVDVWRTTYHHPLAGVAAVVEWFKGTGLRPFLDPLDETTRAAYLARFTDALAEAYPAHPDGTVLLPFPRLFFVASKPA